MNKNQKIALGCGGAGCLGLIIVAIVGGLLWFFVSRAALTNRNFNFNTNSNRNANRQSNSDAESNSDTSGTTTSSSMSDDDKHRLFQAAGMTKDNALIQKVLQRIGFMDSNGTPVAGYEDFVKAHFAWAMKNLSFINSVNTPEKARAYVDEHMSD